MRLVEMVCYEYNSKRYASIWEKSILPMMSLTELTRPEPEPWSREEWSMETNWSADWRDNGSSTPGQETISQIIRRGTN